MLPYTNKLSVGSRSNMYLKIPGTVGDVTVEMVNESHYVRASTCCSKGLTFS